MEEVDLTLVTSQKMAVMALVEAEGFNPGDFEWQNDTQDEHDRDYAVTFRNAVSVLVHKETGFFFRFEKYRSKYSPAHQLRTRIEQWERLIDRDDHVRDWLSNLRTEIEVPHRTGVQESANSATLTVAPATVAVEPQSVFAPDSRNPRAFVSYGSQDRSFVERLATDLRGYGVDAWFDQWEIKTGDPIPSKIDEGLAVCEFFIVVLSAASINRPWVKTELGTALGRLNDRKIRKIIPIRLDDCVLPATISSLRWEDFSKAPYDIALKRVLDSIFDVDVRPPLGLPPIPTNPKASASSFSSSGLKGDTTK